MRKRISFLLLASLALSASACRRSSRAPQSVEELRLSLQIDGQPREPITPSKLRVLQPDFKDEEWGAWRLRKLTGQSLGIGTSITVDFVGGSRAIAISAENVNREPILALDRRGQFVFDVVDPADPFPAFHGRGGNRGRAKDGDRLREVRQISIQNAIALPPATAKATAEGEEPELRVVVDGKSPVRWPVSQWTSAPPLPGQRQGGGPFRKLFPLKNIVTQQLGPKARVVAVLGPEGAVETIDQRSWNSPDRVPTLRLNRRGLIKFQWVDGAFQPSDDREIRGVTDLQVTIDR